MLKNEVGAVLFLGCGPGYESFCYSRNRPQALTIGIDLNHKEFDREVAKYVGFIVCDGAHLPFRNGAFDWEYCAHVLEHMPEDIRTPCVQEIRRTVKHGVLIACPNANRIVSYINSAEKVSLFDVIKWNLFDWLHRLKGDFQNYHRGFTEYELNTMLSNSFHRVYCATVEYDFYMTDKTRYEVLFRVLNKIGLLRRVSPALTFICKPQTI
jgi:SAM-dependent methyltransferase